MSRSLWPLVFVAVGVLLLTNRFYFFPDGVPEERTYRVEAERPADLGDALRETDERDRIVSCEAGSGPYQHRLCLYESLAGPNGSVTLDDRTLSDGLGDPPDLQTTYSFVHVWERGFYEPRTTARNDSITLSLAPVAARTVADRLSPLEYEDASSAVRRAIDEGEATTTVRGLPGLRSTADDGEGIDRFVGTAGALVDKNGTVYRVTAAVDSALAFDPLLLDLARIAGVVVGVVLVALGVVRQRE